MSDSISLKFYTHVSFCSLVFVLRTVEATPVGAIWNRECAKIDRAGTFPFSNDDERGLVSLKTARLVHWKRLKRVINYGNDDEWTRAGPEHVSRPNDFS